MLVCASHVEGFTEYTQLVNLEEIAAARSVDPNKLLRHLGIHLSTGVKHVQDKWLVKGRHSVLTLETLLDMYIQNCLDCASVATHGHTMATHCKTHREATMVRISKIST